MAFDETLATRIRTLLGPETPLTQMKMFGGIAFLDRGNMAVGIMGDDLLVRVGPDGNTTPSRSRVLVRWSSADGR